MIKVVDDCIRSSTTKKIGEFRVKNGIRTLRQEQNIALWSRQVEECNSSGLSVAEWCRENNIPVSTYRNRQRKVFEVFSKDTANGFVEVTVQPEISTTSPIAATISSGNFTADIYNGANKDTITSLLRAKKNAFDGYLFSDYF